MADKRFEVVLFGATGFTGGLVAEYLARQEGLRWAMAGRSREKLAAVRDRLGPAGQGVELLEAEVGDPGSLERMAEASQVVLTTVGPYVKYGEPVVAAAIRGGADYVDITGEPSFVEMTEERYGEAARAAGVRVVSCCGFDSIPSDLGVFFTVQQLPEGVPLTVEGFVRAKGSFSGGTWSSALEIFSQPMERRGGKRAQPAGRTVGKSPEKVRREPRLSAWAAPLPTIDGAVVRRSARALDRYGPEFRYGHHLQIRSLPTLIGLGAGVTALIGLAKIPPAKRLLERVRRPGEGPSPEERAKSRFRIDFFGEGGGARVHTAVSGGDPGYDETAKMVAESALCLARDRDQLPQVAGVLTPAVAMGQPLLARLIRAKIRFEVC